VDFDAFQRDGALKLPKLLPPDAAEALRAFPTAGAGVRLHDARLPRLLAPVTGAASALLGMPARPVRAVLFDKTAEANWAVAWHQDRTIAVAERVEAEGFGPWSRKDGALHVMPPVAVLEQMATVRIHLDPCGPENAPLRVALASHRRGLVPAAEAARAAGEHQELICLAEAGDVWAYSTPILHASDRSRSPSRRRALQVDYAAFELPGGLRWAGVG